MMARPRSSLDFERAPSNVLRNGTSPGYPSHDVAPPFGSSIFHFRLTILLSSPSASNREIFGLTLLLRSSHTSSLVIMALDNSIINDDVPPSLLPAVEKYPS
jgi:hypothetical protein